MHGYKLPALLLAAASTSLAQQPNTLRAVDFTQSMGVNTHLDFGNSSYTDLPATEAAINYLGLHNLRDSPGNTGDYLTWLQVARATNTKFDAYIGETSVADMSTQLGYAQHLAGEGILNFLEGGNEEDDTYPASLGNTVATTAAFQQQVFAAGHSLGLPVINMSFGSGWTADNNWHGDYDKVGNLSSFADYGNAHTYPNAPNGAPDGAIQQLNSDSKLAAASRPVITTEIGWDGNQTGFDPQSVAKYALDAAMDGTKDGDVKTYYYALYDDGSGKFGLMNPDGSPKPAGLAVHNLMTLLADQGTTAATFTPTPLSYSLSGTIGGDNTLVFKKSDGTYWIALWNETEAPGVNHAVTINLASPSAVIHGYDPLSTAQPVQTSTNTTTFQAYVWDHPVLVQIGAASSSGQALAAGTLYTVVNQNSAKCWDATGWGTADGTALEQWQCGWEQPNQEWQFQPTDSGYYTIVNKNASPLVVDAAGQGTGNGTPLQLWSSWGAANQQWLPVPLGNSLYKFVGRQSGRCLDVTDASVNNGAALQLYDCNGTQAQAFQLKLQP